MIKTLSAAVLAISVLAAPAMAAATAKVRVAPATKSWQGKPGVLNANARMGHHHHRHVHHRHHRHHG
jgi:hypothetical protein